MTDLKALAYELLHEAQQSLQEEENLTPTAVVITPTENLIFDLEYDSDEERDTGMKNARCCASPRGARLTAGSSRRDLR